MYIEYPAVEVVGLSMTISTVDTLYAYMNTPLDTLCGSSVYSVYIEYPAVEALGEPGK